MSNGSCRRCGQRGQWCTCSPDDLKGFDKAATKKAIKHSVEKFSRKSFQFSKRGIAKGQRR